MNLAALTPGWLAFLLATVLLAAAAEDAWRMQISNRIGLAVAGGAVLGALLAGPGLELWQNGLLFLAVLAVGTLLFARGAMGGGDVKLLAALSLWFDLAMGWRMLVVVALVGGVEAVVVTILRKLPWPARLRERLALLKAGEDLPYGIAIAIGGVVSLLWVRR